VCSSDVSQVWCLVCIVVTCRELMLFSKEVLLSPVNKVYCCIWAMPDNVYVSCSDLALNVVRRWSHWSTCHSLQYCSSPTLSLLQRCRTSQINQSLSVMNLSTLVNRPLILSKLSVSRSELFIKYIFTGWNLTVSYESPFVWCLTAHEHKKVRKKWWCWRRVKEV
jgi:hypothetical protein